jgi:hypothetical protein
VTWLLAEHVVARSGGRHRLFLCSGSR